jgi:hypothetical protein
MNIIRKLLEGFTKSAMVTFNEVCTSQLALRRGSISQKLFKDTYLHTQLVDVLNDLESVYLDLVGGKLWAGVNALPQASSFKAALADGDDANTVVLAAAKHMPADVKEHALAAVKTLPREEWVKLYATCHHCRENGMVHAWVGQKRLKKYIFKSFYDDPKLSFGHCSNEYKCNTTTTPP